MSGRLGYVSDKENFDEEPCDYTKVLLNTVYDDLKLSDNNTFKNYIKPILVDYLHKGDSCYSLVFYKRGGNPFKIDEGKLEEIWSQLSTFEDCGISGEKITYSNKRIMGIDYIRKCLIKYRTEATRE